MHNVNLVGKAYTMLVDYENTVLKELQYSKTVVRNGKKHSHNKVSDNYLGSLTQADHNSRRSQYAHHGLLY